MAHPPKKSNSSAAVISGNDDLLTEILLFFPAKSLIRFKLVSKRWRTLISSASFSHLHTLHRRRRRPEPRHSFILRHSNSQHFVCHPTVKRLVPFQFPFPSVKILQSCNGLLLLEDDIYPHRRCKSYYVFNPTTNQYSREFYLSKPTGLYLMFDPSKSQHYRILCVRKEQNSTRISVYDSRTREWEKNVTSVDENCNFKDGVYYNGAIYFIRYGHGASFCYSFEDNILHICPSTPPLHAGTLVSYGRTPVGKKNCIIESNGRLHIVRLSTWPFKGIWEVYEMVDHNEWAVMDSVNRGFKADMESKMDLVGMMRGEKAEETVVLYHVPGKIRIYRFVDWADEVLVDFRGDGFYREGELQFRFKDVHPFVHVLAPV